MEETPRWLRWARTVQALAQTGLTYAESPFERERYEKLRDLAVEMFAFGANETPETIGGWFQVQPGYATPKVDVRGACFRDGKILMVREKMDGKWCLPGGWADVGDRPCQSAEREVREESGFECAARKVIGVFDANRGGSPFSAFHAFKIVFLCEIVGGAPVPNHETTAVEFFARAEIPPLSGSRTTPRQLEECFAHLDDPSRPTAFE